MPGHRPSASACGHSQQVRGAAAEVSRLIHEARGLNLPVEPGVRDGRNTLVRWASLLSLPSS
jgi:hypothetical protein